MAREIVVLIYGEKETVFRKRYIFLILIVL